MTEIDEAFFYTFNSDEYTSFWKQVQSIPDPDYFKECIVRPRALITMVYHGIKGDRNEIIGFCIGKAQGNSIYVSDAFSCSTIGTETNCDANIESYQEWYSVMESFKKVGRQCLSFSGWYHSHPDYGCWLSTTDVKAQNNMQTQGPMVALVVDPIKTATMGKVFLGAFRNYPEDYISNQQKYSNSLIPDAKSAEYGASAGMYYQLALNYYLTKADKIVLNDIIKNSWGETLAESPLMTNSMWIGAQIKDQVIRRMALAFDQKSTLPELDTLQNIIRGLNEDQKAGLKIQKMKYEIFG